MKSMLTDTIMLPYYGIYHIKIVVLIKKVKY